MPITDYKITDIERDAVSVEKIRPDAMDPDADITKSWFDTYPDKIRAEHDGLCDYIATMPIAYLSSAAAATAAKGSITGFVPLGGIVELSMTNGNTAVSPTVSIDGVTHTISGMPTTAQVQANSVQTYRLVKTGATVLTFSANPDYICEYGTRVSGYNYRKYASGYTVDGDAFTATITSGGGALTSATVTASNYIKIGKQITVYFDVTITNAGTGTGTLNITLPFVARAYAVGAFNDLSGGGVHGHAQTVLNSSSMTLLKYDNTTIIATGRRPGGSITYITD